MATEPLRVACIGMGWWSDVLADAMKRTDKIEIVVVLHALARTSATPSRRNTAASRSRPTRRCWPTATIEAIVNTTPNDVHLPTTKQAAAAGKHVFLDKPIANNVTEGRAITEVCRKAGVVLGMGYQRRRESHFRWIKQQIDAGVFGKVVNAEANISRDRLGKIDLNSWRYQAVRDAGRRDAADRHPLHRRADLPDGAGEGGARAVRAARAARRQSRTWRA